MPNTAPVNLWNFAEARSFLGFDLFSDFWWNTCDMIRINIRNYVVLRHMKKKKKKKTENKSADFRDWWGVSNITHVLSIYGMEFGFVSSEWYIYYVKRGFKKLLLRN